MAAEPIIPFRVTDSNGHPYSGAKLRLYEEGTLTPQAVFADADLSTSLGAVLTADSGGLFPAAYFDSSQVYRGICENASGSVTIFDMDPINSNALSELISDLAASPGSSLIGFIQSGTGAVSRSVESKLRDVVSVKDFGAVGDGTTDDTAAIQKAIDAVSTTGGVLHFPAGIYKHTGLVWKNGATYEGVGFDVTGNKGSVLLYTGTGDATVINNPVNASTFAAINFIGLSFRCAALSSGKALLYDTGSSYLNIERCRFSFAGSGAFGLVLDQSEVVGVHQNVFEASADIGSGAMIWLANGPTTKNPTAVAGYTNRITISDGNQINPALGGAAAIGIRDDGGSVHSYKDNNFNGGAYAIKLGNPITVSIEGNEIEGYTQAGVYFSTVGGGIVGLRHVGNFYVAAVPSLKFEAGSVLEFTNTDNVHQTPSSVACETGIAAGVSGKNFSVNNRQISVGLAPFNNYLELDTDTVGTVTLAGSTTPGANTYSSQYISWRRFGDLCFFNLFITLTAKDAAMAGDVRVAGLPFAAKTASNGTTACNIGYVSNITLDASYTQYAATIGAGNNYIDLLELRAGFPAALVDASKISATTTIHISGTYMI